MRALEASWHRRYGNPLRLPGDGGWFAPVRANTLSRLVAVPGAYPLRGNRASSLWVYRTEIQGRTLVNPLLVGRPGDQVAFRFENRIEQPSIIHWHGFANDARNDGGGMEVAASGSSHDYHWTVHNEAGLNWYHPHPHERSGEQLWRGMSGLFIVEDDASDRLARSLGVSFGRTDIPLILQDRTIGRSGDMPYADNSLSRAASGMDEVARLSLEALCTSGGALFHGAQGDDILVNATRFPFVRAPRRWVRFRILNASNARIYRLAFQQEGQTLPFSMLGIDGALLQAPLEVNEVFLAAAQRVDVAIDLRRAKVGDLWLKTLSFDPMHNDTRSISRQAAVSSLSSQRHVHGPRGEGAEEPVLRIDVKENDGLAGLLPHEIAGSSGIPRFDGRLRDFVLDHDEAGRWCINGKVFHDAQDAFHVQRGAREVWAVRNVAEGMPHAMHLHGFSFDVLSRGGSPSQLRPLVLDAQGRTAQDLGRADTVLVWPGETVRIGIDFSMPFPAPQRYMFHCHNLEHEDLGMMLGFSVGAGERSLAAPSGHGIRGEPL